MEPESTRLVTYCWAVSLSFSFLSKKRESKSVAQSWTAIASFPFFFPSFFAVGGSVHKNKLTDHFIRYILLIQGHIPFGFRAALTLCCTDSMRGLETFLKHADVDWFIHWFTLDSFQGCSVGSRYNYFLNLESTVQAIWVQWVNVMFKAVFKWFEFCDMVC